MEKYKQGGGEGCFKNNVLKISFTEIKKVDGYIKNIGCS